MVERIPLGDITATSNIHPNIQHSTPTSNKNGKQMKRNLVFMEHENEDEVSPKLKRARMLKMKLKLAYFKVKTNQTDIPINSLKLTSKQDAAKSQHEKPQDPVSIFDRTMTAKKRQLKPKKNGVGELRIDMANVMAGTNIGINDVTSNKTRMNPPFSAPPTILAFANTKHTASSTSPSKFANTPVVTPTSRTFKLPPLSKLFDNPSPSANIFNPQRSIGHDQDTTIEENESTILQNESTHMSTPIKPLNTIASTNKLCTITTTMTSVTNNNDHHNNNNKTNYNKNYSHNNTNNNSQSTLINHTEINDPDTTILQSNSLIFKTPIRSINNKQPQISPSKLSTPLSMGAAKCLLQLAHR